MIELLIVDDDDLDREIMRKSIKIECDIDEASSASEAFEKASKKDYNSIIIDYKLPDYDGKELLKKLLSITDKPLIIVTGQGNEILAVEMIKLGAFDYIPKDFVKSLDDIITRSILNYNVKKSKLESISKITQEIKNKIQSEEDIK